MLRFLFDEPRRVDDAVLEGANRSILRYCSAVKGAYVGAERIPEKAIRLEFRAREFLASLNELEQSKYCSDKYYDRIHSAPTNQQLIDLENLNSLYFYFYKNALVRIFATLDKLGYFMDDMFDLQTRRVKRRFSYFTVLRQLHAHKEHARLDQTLFEIKNAHQPALHRLRVKRNYQIHSINAEMLADLINLPDDFGATERFDEPEGPMSDLQQGYDTVVRSLTEVFTYCGKLRLAQYFDGVKGGG